MLKTAEFNNDELVVIQKNLKGFRIYFFIYLKLFVPASFFLGLLGLRIREIGYLPLTGIFLFFFFLIIIYVSIKENILIKKDFKNKLKYTGTIKVLKKSRNRNDCLIYTDSKEIEKIDVIFFDVFDQIEAGDELLIDISVNNKYIFRLDKGSIRLIDGLSDS